MRWISFVATASATSSTSSMVTMPMSMPDVSVTGSADRSCCLNTATADCLVVGRLAARRSAGPSGPARVLVGEVSRNSRIRMSSIEQPLLVDHVDDVERFAVLPVRRGCSRARR